MGETEASRAFASLYRRKVAPASQTLTVKTIYRGGDTDKYVFELPDGKCIETVCIKRRDGATVCVSTQVGCPVHCKFCESGKNGFVRNLTPSEIVQQVVLLGRKITRIVYMGMGEPLFNYDNVIQSIHILRDRNGLNFPTDGITLSTTGPLDRLKRLREEYLKIQFTLSLHATTQAVRDRLIPGVKNYPIDSVVFEHLCVCRWSRNMYSGGDCLRSPLHFPSTFSSSAAMTVRPHWSLLQRSSAQS